MTINPFQPSSPLLAKLGSLIVHAEEAMRGSDSGYDYISFGYLLKDPEVKEWMKSMDGLSLLPKKRE